MFRNSGLGFFTASAMLDPYYVVTLILNFSAFSYRAAAKNPNGHFLRTREWRSQTGSARYAHHP
jgi:hypothetical protein